MIGDDASSAAPRLARQAAAAAHPHRPGEGVSSVGTRLSAGGGRARSTAVAAAAAEWWEVDIRENPNTFLHQLQREKRRAERSRAPLSIALFCMDDDAAGDIDRLLEIVHIAKRETDILGHAEHERIAVLCPDTDEEGMQGFVRKIEARAGGLRFTTVAATYPDHLFDALGDGHAAGPDLPRPFFEDAPGSRAQGYPLKRVIDIVGALVGVAVFAPLMLVIAAVIAWTSPGPVIFRQMRLGKGGRPFVFYKFRSMTTGNDDRIHREFVASLIKGGAPPAGAEANTGRVYKLKRDPRVTPVGRFIRKTSIDELPQFFNVLKGDMSLVGPRPPIPYEAANYQAWHLRRVLSVKPGLTGLWQVEGRSKVDFDEMVRMDLRYVRDCSLATDLKIIFKTFFVVLRCDGAS